MASITTAQIIVLIRGLIKDNLQSDGGENSFRYDSDSAFKLSEPFISSSTIKVYHNGTLMSTNDWSYNSDTNRVTITPVTSGVSLVKNDDIIITFSYYNSYSDTEITSYIKSNLIHFTIKRYKKDFYMDDDDAIVTLDGENPTQQEGYIIAGISAIDIDPQNVIIKTPDFTIYPNETKSKTQQINDVLDAFMRAFGDVDFMETE